MYITINGTNYNARKPQQSIGTWWRIRLTDEPELTIPVSGVLPVCGNDGFELCTVDTSKYSRQTYEAGLLTLTNEAEPEPEPEPDPAEVLAAAKTVRIAESKTLLSTYLMEHPLQWVDGEYYNVTEEKQALLTSQLALQSIADAAGVERELKWNTTGGICTVWTYENLAALALAIGAYVQPLVTLQQTIEVTIQACQTVEDVEAVEIDYSTVYETE